MDYSKLSEEELLAEIMKIEDWERLPLPIAWYKKYNITAPKPVNISQYTKEMQWLKCQYNPTTKWEVRTEPAPGGLRPVLDTSQPTVELNNKQANALIDQIVSDNQQSMQREREDSTAKNTTSILDE
jgi:hypothetical protein